VRKCRFRLTRGDAWNERKPCALRTGGSGYPDIHPFRLVTDARLSLHTGELRVHDA
jgi:hypothetical protein